MLTFWMEIVEYKVGKLAAEKQLSDFEVLPGGS